MRTRIISGVILTVFLIPSILFIRDEFRGRVNLTQAARAVSETFGRGKAWFTEQEALAYEAEIAAEDERLAADIKETEELIATSPSGRRSDLDQHLIGLQREREAVQNLKRAHLDSLNAQRLAHAEFRLMKVRDDNLRRQLPYVREILGIRQQQERTAAIRIERQLAAFVNEFLDALESGDLQAVRAASANGLRPCLTREKVRALAKSAPGGAMTFASAANGVIVVRFAGRPDATLTLAAGESGVEVVGVW